MKKEDKKVAEEKKFKISEIYTNKRYYAIANLVFYSVIILFLIAAVRSNPTIENKDINKKDNGVVQLDIKGFEYIKNKNFKEVVYEGKQYNDKNLFENALEKKEYFKTNNVLLEKKEQDYILNNQFKVYFDFFDVDLINNILKASILEDEEYFITNKVFSEKVGFTQSDDELNGVYINITKQNGIITGLEFDLSEISKVEQSIKLEYKNYGLIEDFDIN